MTYNQLVLWNIDLTLVDVARVTRAAYAEAFAKVAGQPLVHLPQLAGRTEPEVFFDALALNEADMSEASEALLEPFSAELAKSMQARRDELTTQGQLMPGAADALKAAQSVAGSVQTVLTGTSRANALLKLTAFSLEGFLDLEVGGYGDEVYPKGTLLSVVRDRASEKYGTVFDEANTVYIGDSPRDVAAAKTGGARSIAVASGRSTVTELGDAGPDAVLPDLTDSAALLRLLMQ
jgi:phosphoglycolate phosphatase-like HAD superfamily hydrolase